MVAIAGGDGAVRKMLRKLAGRPRVPVLILATGTANNIARSLGCDGPWEEAVASMDRRTPRPFRFGRVACGEVDDWFFESVGLGLFAGFLHLAEGDPRLVDFLTRRRASERDYAALAHMAGEVPAIELTLVSGERQLRETCVWLEVLNIPAMGPRLALADAECMGGEIHVALVPESKRDELVAYFEGLLNREEVSFPGIIWTGGPELRIAWPGGEYHVDDESQKVAGGEAVLELSRVEEALVILAP